MWHLWAFVSLVLLWIDSRVIFLLREGFWGVWSMSLRLLWVWFLSRNMMNIYNMWLRLWRRWWRVIRLLILDFFWGFRHLYLDLFCSLFNHICLYTLFNKYMFGLLLNRCLLRGLRLRLILRERLLLILRLLLMRCSSKAWFHVKLFNFDIGAFSKIQF